MPMVSFRSLPAHCPHDYGFLGKAADQAPIGSVPESSVELWTARQLAETIHHFQHRKPSAPEYDLAACLRRLAIAHKIKDAAEFGRFLGVSRITAWYWLRGQAKPSLTHVIDLCHRFGVNLIDLLEQRVARHGTVYPVDVPRIPDNPRNKSALTEAKIKAVLRANASNPPSLEALARKLGVYPKLLKKLFPALSRQVMDAYACHHRQHRQEYEARVIQAVRKAAKYLVAEGFLLNRKNLATQMAKPGVFRWPNIQKAADQIIREMGR
jgi:AraC-like DNA-binding protein